MTRVLIAFDKFKDALTARQACESAASALRTNHPDWVLDLCPLTDGGEGFCDTLTRAVNGHFTSLECSGPRGSLVVASFGNVAPQQVPVNVRRRLELQDGSSLAVIEMASASGLALLPANQRDPWRTSSRGTGELIRAAIESHADAIMLGVGGSATNDLGLGALTALGFEFIDANDGARIDDPTPATWEKIIRIECANTGKAPRVFIACDVTNPLLGQNGATAIFGPQKGLQPGDEGRLEAQATRMAALLCDACHQPHALIDVPGAGAAGGISFGLMVACQARLVSGFGLVSEWLDLPARVARADLVLTGEGRFDATSLGGKGPGSLVAAARQLGKGAHVFAGSVGLADGLRELDGVQVHAITPSAMSLADALPRTAELLASAVSRSL